MGIGIHPHGWSHDKTYAAHSRCIARAYENAKFHFVNPIDTELYASDPHVYDIQDAGYSDEYWGRLILYDGPGRIKGA